MATYLVTGTARGLGLALVKALSSTPDSEISTIFATVRSSPPQALQDLVASSNGRIVIISLEVTKPESIDAAVKEVKEKLGGRGLDVLINNAAVNPADTVDGIEHMNGLANVLGVNVEAVHKVTVGLLPLLREGNHRTVLNMSSITGSITQAEKWMIANQHAYRISKAALNEMTAIYAQDLKKEGFTFIAVSPGWLKTDQGGPWADLDADIGAKATLDLLKRPRDDVNGKFMNIHVPGWEQATGLHKYDGKEIPW
ncbi:uncharacterized protein BDV14DRAFT_199571 [Aspergillus stella-maris]|uniref:uncharacterized protein n=1 Tax=Aspergillus stella-maris TaxID=1810926 RepID=UPI003CCD5CAD